MRRSALDVLAGVIGRSAYCAEPRVRVRSGFSLCCLLGVGWLRRTEEGEMAEPAVRSAVLLDAHPMWLDALVLVLERVGVEVVARTSSPAEALAALAEHQPDLFILDPLLAGGEAAGLACLRAACAELPTLRAVVISGSDEPAAVRAAFEAGASIYALKRASSE